MTVFRWILKKCHWPVNDIFGCNHGWDHGATCTFRKCHWQVNDSFRKIPKKMLKETVIDWSMTVWVTNIARTYGHVSLTPVNDNKFMDICHWLQSMTEIYGQTCQKVSLTAVNDKKKCHWLDVYYIWIEWSWQLHDHDKSIHDFIVPNTN